ncbi:hypothetical protein BSKO_04108 [Bryopsis sp. KO-2023]|nr:hypothetical protein BSKO_04108 [Bryopsis sp. KO-2023]
MTSSSTSDTSVNAQVSEPLPGPGPAPITGTGTAGVQFQPVPFEQLGIQNITAMNNFSQTSTEELRAQDYRQNNATPPTAPSVAVSEAQVQGENSGPSLFGAQAPRANSVSDGFGSVQQAGFGNFGMPVQSMPGSLFGGPAQENGGGGLFVSSVSGGGTGGGGFGSGVNGFGQGGLGSGFAPAQNTSGAGFGQTSEGFNSGFAAFQNNSGGMWGQMSEGFNSGFPLQNTATSTPPGATGFGFGNNGFGQTSEPAHGPTSGLQQGVFMNLPNQGTGGGGGAFGAANQGAGAGGVGFGFGPPSKAATFRAGLNAQSQAPTGGSLFGQPAANQGAGGGALFGQQNSGAFGGSLFGGQNQGHGGESNLFNPPSLFGPNAPRSNVFGQARFGSGGLFGQPNPRATRVSLFDQLNPRAARGSLFGQPNPRAAGGNLFGQPNPGAAGGNLAAGGGLFGQPNPGAAGGNLAAGGSLFGQPNPGAAGGNLAAGGSLFGQPNPGATGGNLAAGGSLFGQPSPGAAGGNLFGQPNPGNGGNGFGQQNQATGGGSLFGQGSGTSLFGQPQAVFPQNTPGVAAVQAAVQAGGVQPTQTTGGVGFGVVNNEAEETSAEEAPAENNPQENAQAEERNSNIVGSTIEVSGVVSGQNGGQPANGFEGTSSGIAPSELAVQALADLPKKPPPRSFICPIGLRIMKKPVTMVSTGISYDKQSLESWFAARNLPVPPTMENKTLEDLIEEWQVEYEENSVPTPKDEKKE